MSIKFVFALIFISFAVCGDLENTLVVPRDQNQLSMTVKAGETFNVEIAGNPT